MTDLGKSGHDRAEQEQAQIAFAGVMLASSIELPKTADTRLHRRTCVFWRRMSGIMLGITADVSASYCSVDQHTH